MNPDDPKFVLEMLRTGMIGLFNYGLDATPLWMRDAILDVAEQVKRTVQDAGTPVPIGGGLNATPISADDALWYRAAVATQAVLTDPPGHDRSGAYNEFLRVLWELPEPPAKPGIDG